MVQLDNDYKKKIKMNRTLFHGTQKKLVADIVKNGFNQLANQGGWYQMATDFESALFHCSTAEKKPEHVYVIEFNVKSTDELWNGYPNLFPAYERDESSSWFAVKEILPSEMIVAVHQVPYDLYIKQKSRGFNKSEHDLIACSKNILVSKQDNTMTL